MSVFCTHVNFRFRFPGSNYVRTSVRSEKKKVRKKPPEKKTRRGNEKIPRVYERVRRMGIELD